MSYELSADIAYDIPDHNLDLTPMNTSLDSGVFEGCIGEYRDGVYKRINPVDNYKCCNDSCDKFYISEDNQKICKLACLKYLVNDQINNTNFADCIEQICDKNDTDVVPYTDVFVNDLEYIQNSINSDPTVNCIKNKNQQQFTDCFKRTCHSQRCVDNSMDLYNFLSGKDTVEHYTQDYSSQMGNSNIIILILLFIFIIIISISLSVIVYHRK